MSRRVTTVSCLLLGLVACESNAGDVRTAKLAELSSANMIGLTAAIAIAEHEVTGGVTVAAQLEIEPDEVAYEVQIYKDSQLWEVEIDPQSGAVLEVEIEEEDDDDERD